jgi:hypothetical protein
MPSKADSLHNWSDELTQAGTARSWLPMDDCMAQQPLPPDELMHRLGLPGALALFGLALLGLGGLFLLPSVAYIAAGQTTEGIVVKIAKRPSSRGTMYAPVVGYIVHSEEYLVSSSASSSWNTYRVGDAVPVLYFANDPEQAAIGDFQQLYLFPCIFGVPGLALTIGGLGFGFYVVRKAGWRILPA